MPKKLYNILVPVDFSGRSKWAITKAIELANTFQCNVHLVHVVSKNLLPLIPIEASNILPYDATVDMNNARRKLEAMKEVYQQHLVGGGNIEISLLQGRKSTELHRYIEKYDMDLVVIGLSRFNLVHRILSSVSISRLARMTSVPVLAIRSSGLVSHFRKLYCRSPVKKFPFDACSLPPCWHAPSALRFTW